MIWKLLLMLAVLGNSNSNGEADECTTYSDCEGSPCTTCSNGVCGSYTCSAGLKCFGDGKCMCVVDTCKGKCGTEMTYCCSADASNCNCCTKDQTCYKWTVERATSSWGHDMLHMEKARRIVSQTCQNLCNEDSGVCVADNCEKFETDPNDNSDPKRKVCMPCSVTKPCNNGETACCTGSGPDGCDCCKAGHICKDKSCQFDAASCSALCGGTCDSGSCTPGACDGGQTCQKNENGGKYSCQ